MAIIVRAVFLTVLAGSLSATPQTTDVSPIAGFVENRGQWASEIVLASRHGRIDASITDGELVLRPSAPILRGRDGVAPRVGTAPAPVVLRFADGHGVAEGVDVLPTKLHVLRGPEGRGPGAATHIPVFERATMWGVAEGVDVDVRRGDGGFAYDLRVAAGVPVDEIVVELEGAWAPELTPDGALVVETAAGPFMQTIGRSWEVGGGDVEARFARIEATSETSIRFGFDVPERDVSRALVIDPDLVFATYLGGAGQELPRGMDVGSDGATYITSQGFFDPPTTPGAFDPDWTSNSIDVWVCCLSPDGSALDWATLVSSDDVDDPYGVGVDSDGTVVVFGMTWAAAFPTTVGALQPDFAGDPGKNDLFITKLSGDGSSLVWSTFYGGPVSEVARLSTMAPDGDVIIVAEPLADTPSATPGAFDTVHEDGKHLVARISADGTTLRWQGYLPFRPGDLDVGDDGTIYVGGRWFPGSGLSFQATPGAFVESPPADDLGSAVVVVISPDGSTIEWSTLVTLPGVYSETVTGIAVGPSGAVYITGNISDAFPVTPGAFDTQTTGGAYVAKLLDGGRGLVWATYISACCGGTSNQRDIDVDTAGRATIVGSSNEPNYPVTPDALQPNFPGPFPAGDGHFTRFDAFGEQLVYSTYYGGFGNNSADYVSVAGTDMVTIGVFTFSNDIITTPQAFDTTYNEGGDTAIVRLDLGVTPWRVRGGGADGVYGKPNLAGAGELASGSPTRLSVRGGRESASAFLVAGIAVIEQTVKGGVLVPSPDLLVPLTLDASGSLDLVFPWITLPAGIEVTVQTWIEDPEGAKNWSATNALTIGAR